MNGETTKYYYYDKTKQSRVNIPVSIARSLNWKHLDNIKLIIDVKEGKKGIFLFKDETK